MNIVKTKTFQGFIIIGFVLVMGVTVTGSVAAFVQSILIGLQYIFVGSLIIIGAFALVGSMIHS
jgi:hypothetical protein